MPLLVGVAGFLMGIALNLFADYLALRRHYHLALHSPFSTVKPHPPHFLPRRADGSLLPLWRWSALIGAFQLGEGFHPPRHARRIGVEIGVALIWALIIHRYGNHAFSVFYLAYALILILCIVSDIENRWIYLEVLAVGAALAILESISGVRLALGSALQGGLLGFVIFWGLYVGGLVFGGLVQRGGRRAVGRTVLGFGDVYLVAFCGLILGGEAVGSAVLLMLICGGIAALGLILTRRLRGKKYRRFSAIPYAPPIVIGAGLMLLFPDAAVGVLFWLLALI
ncbi:MAG: prepilin peptidase [Anaerolinea sp.]|nr:prepilin peptidase [Anaerolinea sp.]